MRITRLVSSDHRASLSRRIWVTAPHPSVALCTVLHCTYSVALALAICANGPRGRVPSASERIQYNTCRVCTGAVPLRSSALPYTFRLLIAQRSECEPFPFPFPTPIGHLITSHPIPSHPISLSVFILQSANVKWLRTHAEVRTHQFDGWRRIDLFDKWFPSTRCLAPRTKAPIRSALIVCDVEAIDVRLREPRRVASLDVQTLRAAPRHRHRRSAVTPIAFDFNDYSTRVNSIRKAKRRYGTQRSAEQRSAEQLVTRS